MRKMEAEARIGGDADVAGRNMPEKNRAGRLARTDNAHAHAALRQPRPAGIVLGHGAAVVIGHIDRFGSGRRRSEKK